MAPKVVVELTPDEDRLLNAFRKAEAADEAYRKGLGKTGTQGASAGKQIADSMIKAGKESRTSIDRILQQISRVPGEGAKLGPKMKGFLSEMELGGRRSVDSLIGDLERLDPVLAAQAHIFLDSFAEADKAEKFESTRRQLDALGGEFAVLGKEIKKATDAPLTSAKARASEIIAELSQIDPDQANALADAMDRTAEAVQSSRLDEFVSKLASGSKEARELAKAIGVDTKDAALLAEGGIDGIANKIIALRPELASTVDKWRADMQEAAKFGEGQYEKALNALRAGGPVSKEVAGKIRENLVASGKIVERTFEDMIAPLEKIDPVMADQARKMKAELDGIEKRGKGAFSGLANFAKSELVQVAAAYVGVQEAVQFVTDLIQQQQQVLKDAASSHRSLATAQVEAFKNLSTLKPEQQKDLLENFVKEVAQEQAFPDLVNLTKAVGDARSAGGNIEQLKEAVSAAAALTALNSEFVDETAAALIDTARATGNTNAKQNASQLFVIGAESRVVDPAKLFRNVAPVQVAGSVIAGEGREAEGARQGGAIFAALSKSGADAQGDASQTASIQFINRMSEFFGNLGKDATGAKKELAALKKQDPLSASQRNDMRQLEAKQAASNRVDQARSDIETKLATIDSKLEAGGLAPQQAAELSKLQRGLSQRLSGMTAGGLEKQIAAIQSKQDSGKLGRDESRAAAIQKRKLKALLSDVSSAEFTDKDAARLADIRTRIGDSDRKFQTKVAELEGKIAAGNVKGFRGKIPQTPLEQLRAFHSNPELKRAFAADKFGEQRFRPGYDQLLNQGDAFRDFKTTVGLLNKNQGSDQLFQEKVAQQRFGTAALEESYNQRLAETAEMIQDSFSSNAAMAGSVREEVASVLEKTRSDNAIVAGAQYASELWIRSGSLRGNQGAEEIVSGLGALASRHQSLSTFGVTPEEQPKIDRLEQAMEVALNRAASQAVRGESPERLRAAADRASRINDAIRNPHNTVQNVSGVDIHSARNSKEIFLRLEQSLLRQIELQEQLLTQSNKTATNTRPRPERTTNAASTAAAGTDQRSRQ